MVAQRKGRVRPTNPNPARVHDRVTAVEGTGRPARLLKEQDGRKYAECRFMNEVELLRYPHPVKFPSPVNATKQDDGKAQDICT